MELAQIALLFCGDFCNAGLLTFGFIYDTMVTKDVAARLCRRWRTMMTRIYIPFYFEWAELFSGLSDAEYGRLVKGILAFAMGKEGAPRLSREANMAYRIITASIARAEGHRLGTDSRKNEEKSGKEPIKFKRIERQSPTEAEISDDIKEQLPTNDDICEAKEYAPDTSEEKSAPTREQVRNFFKKQGFTSNPDEFFNFYESNGWKVGQNPMINWYSSAENWEIRANREGKSPKTDENPPRQGDFDIHEAFKLALERSYGNMDDEEG